MQIAAKEAIYSITKAKHTQKDNDMLPNPDDMSRFPT